MDLLEKIDDLRAKSVTPKRFKQVFGISIDEHLQQLMALIAQQDKDCPANQK